MFKLTASKIYKTFLFLIIVLGLGAISTAQCNWPLLRGTARVIDRVRPVRRAVRGTAIVVHRVRPVHRTIRGTALVVDRVRPIRRTLKAQPLRFTKRRAVLVNGTCKFINPNAPTRYRVGLRWRR